MVYEVEFSEEADEDLQTWVGFAMLRERNSESGNLEILRRALQAIQVGMAFFRRSPFSCRKAGISPFTRETVIAFGSSGSAALFEIVDHKTVFAGAIRHQRKDDYHYFARDTVYRVKRACCGKGR